MPSRILFLRATQILLLAVMAVGIASEALAQQPASPDQRHPPIVPQRLHGALLERDARRPGGAPVPATACVVTVRRLPAGGERHQGAGRRESQSAAREGRDRRRTAETAAAPAEAAATRGARRARQGGQGSVEEGAARGRGPRLRRRLPHPLPRHSAGHRRCGRLSEAQRGDIVGGVPACARVRRRRPQVEARSPPPAAAPAAAPAPVPRRPSRRRCWFAARGNVHPAHVVPRRLRQVLPRACVSAPAGSRRACTTTPPTCRRRARPRSPRCAKAAEALPCQARGNAFEPRKPQREK